MTTPTLYTEHDRAAALKRLRAEYGHPLADDQLTDLIPPAKGAPPAGGSADDEDISDLIPKARSHTDIWKNFHASARRNSTAAVTALAKPGSAA
ncbi:MULTISPECIES: hypothetical protein [unclassified Devosia]|uniref:hypothetical protein n=1 Tax=unclassified Devosia TaxID=196773 RepID=UPI001AC35D3A|nr:MULTISPECIES: hypothetical protein [unclassified Devosia]MBN9307224.1 hypothetical protein [Devosia sp.]